MILKHDVNKRKEINRKRKKTVTMNEFLELQYNIESCKLESKMLYDVDSYMFNTYKMALYEGGGYDDEVIDLLYEKAVSDHIEKKKGILRRMIDAIRTFITKFVTRKQIEEVKNIDTHEIDRSAMINSIPPQEIEKAFNDIHREYAKLWNESKNGKSISDEELEKLLLVEVKTYSFVPGFMSTRHTTQI